MHMGETGELDKLLKFNEKDAQKVSDFQTFQDARAPPNI